jgi:hypothetical protein
MPEKIPSEHESVPGGLNQPREPERKPETTRQLQVTAAAKKQPVGLFPKIFLTVGIISLTLGALAQSGAFLKDISTPPILEHPLLDETSPVSGLFQLRNKMSFFTMHDTCAVTITGSEILDPAPRFIGDELSHRLGDIGPGKPSYIEMPVLQTPVKPAYGSSTFFVRYYVNVLGGHWARYFYVGTCQWILETKVMWECPESANPPTIVPQLRKALAGC